MSKIIVRKQEYANNGTHADEIKAVVRDDLITQTLTSDTDLVPSSKAVKDALSPFIPYGITPRDGRYVGNLDDINVGVYYVDPGAATNCPVTAWGWCVSFNDSKTDSVTYVKTQFYFTTNTFVLYMRHRNNNGTWTAWKSITFT